MAIIGIELDSDLLVLTRGRDFKWSFENQDEDGVATTYPAGDLYFELDTGGEQNEIQEITVDKATNGTYTLTFDGETTSAIDYYDITGNPQGVDGDITDALEALSNIGAGNVSLTPVSMYPTWRMDVQFGQNQNEIQKISVSGSSIITFRLGFRGKFTAPLSVGSLGTSYIQTALEGLSTVGSGNVTVTSTTGGYLVEFVNDLALRNVPEIEVFGFPLGASISVSTTQAGTPGLTEQTINLLNTTINSFFDNFENLLGVDLDFTVNDQFHATFVAQSRKSYSESGLLTFVNNVASTAIADAIDAVTDLAGVLNGINVSFYWKHTFQVEFVGDLANLAHPQITSDVSSLDGPNDEASVTVSTVQEGKERYDHWHFDISGSTASLKVESDVCDLVANRTKWQLVFQATGEAAGGDPIARGLVRTQD